MSSTPEQDKAEDMRREESVLQDLKGGTLDSKDATAQLKSLRQVDDVTWTLEEESKLKVSKGSTTL